MGMEFTPAVLIAAMVGEITEVDVGERVGCARVA